MKTAIVVVLGDVSQSPRTINHFRSLINEGYYTHIVGYGSNLFSFLDSLSLDSDRSHFHPIKRMQSSVLIDIPFITFLFVCWKAILLVFHLAFVLFRISHADVVLVQVKKNLNTRIHLSSLLYLFREFILGIEDLF